MRTKSKYKEGETVWIEWYQIWTDDKEKYIGPVKIMDVDVHTSEDSIWYTISFPIVVGGTRQWNIQEKCIKHKIQ